MNLEDLRDRDQALTVPCTWCGANPGELCRLRDHPDRPLVNFPAHIGRLKAARVVHAPLDPRDLAAPHERNPE